MPELTWDNLDDMAAYGDPLTLRDEAWKEITRLRAELARMTPPIEIYQDNEYDGEEFSAPLPVFWAKGHDLNHNDFLRAVVEYCIEECDFEIPAMSWDDDIDEQWQRNVEVPGGGVEYWRTTEPPEYPGSMEGKETFPITILDLEKRRRGAHKCSVTHCREPWSVGSPARVRVSTDEKEVSVYLWLCREHLKAYPEPSYRVCMIPVGATIMLPPTCEGCDRPKVPGYCSCDAGACD